MSMYYLLGIGVDIELLFFFFVNESMLFIWDDEVFSKVYGLLSSVVLAFVVDSWSRYVVWP
jgi:hypothetical protein